MSYRPVNWLHNPWRVEFGRSIPGSETLVMSHRAELWHIPKDGWRWFLVPAWGKQPVGQGEGARKHAVSNWVTVGTRVMRGQQGSVAQWGLNRCHLTLVRSSMGWTWLELRGVGRDQQQTATLVSGGVVFGFSQKQAVTLCC